MSYLAQQILIDRPDYWEYKLTAELLRAGLEPLVWRWQALNDKLYHRQGPRIGPEAVVDWYQDHVTALPRQMEAVTGLLNDELSKAWGPPGTAGSELAILRTTSLITEACGRILKWEEDVRFANLPVEFEECRELLAGIGGRALEGTFSVPQQLASMLATEGLAGQQTISVVYDLPDGWEKRITAAFALAMRQLLTRAI